MAVLLAVFAGSIHAVVLGGSSFAELMNPSRSFFFVWGCVGIRVNSAYVLTNLTS